MQVIGGFLRGRRLECPKGLAVRPTSSMLRESLFNICQHEIEGTKFLDLFAGSGAVGIEAISRGAKEAVFVDRNMRALQYIKKNLSKLGIMDHSRVFMGDAMLLIRKILSQQEPFDMIYIDPPYKCLEGEKYLVALLLEIKSNKLLRPDGKLFVESKYDKSQAEREFSIEGYQLMRTKKVGNALLQIFQLSGK